MTVLVEKTIVQVQKREVDDEKQSLEEAFELMYPEHAGDRLQALVDRLRENSSSDTE